MVDNIICWRGSWGCFLYWSLCMCSQYSPFQAAAEHPLLSHWYCHLEHTNFYGCLILYFTCSVSSSFWFFKLCNSSLVKLSSPTELKLVRQICSLLKTGENAFRYFRDPFKKAWGLNEKGGIFFVERSVAYLCPDWYKNLQFCPFPLPSIWPSN